jgi:hypothetical protein
MEQTEQLKIYDELLTIKIEIEREPIVRPEYIGEKIWECHHAIEKVEHSSIEVTREISVIQQALTNAEMTYDAKLENLITTDPIKNLPSIRDRTARANDLLKPELNDIRSYKNDLTVLTQLTKAIDQKLKNLNRLNADIRTLVRVMESQIKLGSKPKTDPVTQSLMDEMKKSEMDTDFFMSPESSVEQVTVIDPTLPVNVDNLLSEDNPSTENNNLSSNSEEDRESDAEEDKESDAETEEEAYKNRIFSIEEDPIELDSQEVLPEEPVDLDQVLVESAPVKKEEMGIKKEETIVTLPLTPNPGLKKEEIPASTVDTKIEQKTKNLIGSGIDLEDFLDGLIKNS